MTPYFLRKSLLAGLFCVAISLCSSAQDSPYDLSIKNHYHFELGGWGEFYSLNYERTLSSEVKKRSAKAVIGRVGASIKPGEAWVFAAGQYLKPFNNPVGGFDNIFWEAGAGPIYYRDLSLNKQWVYPGVTFGLRKQPSISNMWLVKGHLDVMFLRTRPETDNDWLGYVFPYFGISIGRGF